MNKEVNLNARIQENTEDCAVCRKKTKFMFPVPAHILCEEHGEGLCCLDCFQTYFPHFPERMEIALGHCYNGLCECHKK